MIASSVLLSALQTTLWFSVLGTFPAPLFWLVLLVYISVTRPLWEATLMTYLICLANTGFTVLPFEELLVFGLIIMVLLMFIRERVFWGGTTYFMLMVGLASVTAPILFWIVSRWFDGNPIFIPNIFDWLISILLTLLASHPLYSIYQWIDRVAALDAGTEGRVGPR